MLKIAKSTHNRLSVSLADKPLAVVCRTFGDAKHYREAAKILNLDAEYIAGCVAKFREAGTESFPVPVTGEGFTVTLRGLREAAGQQFQGSPATAFRTALEAACPAAEPILTWDGIDRIAALDIDWHGSLPPENVTQLLDSLRPVPAVTWITRSGGLRAVYFADGHPAADYAAAAALWLSKRSGSHRAELKSVTRQHGQTPPVWRTQGTDCSAILQWFGERTVEDTEVADWLAARGLEVGKRYSHTLCPMQPSDKGGNEPVSVTEDGVRCYYCQASGRFFISFAELIGGSRLGRLAACVRNFVHWDHAEYVIGEQPTMGPEVLRAAYRAALRLHHGDDPRVERVFTAGKDFVRHYGCWANRRGELWKDSKAEGMLVTLPVCQTPDGKPRCDQVARFSQPVSLEAFGYLPLQPVFGVCVSEQELTSAVRVVTPTAELACEENRRLRPRYLSPGERISESDCWQRLDNLLPGLPVAYLKLLLAAKFAIDDGAPMPPFLYVHGPSGASKTGSVQIAASILGDHAAEIAYSPNDERLRQGVMEAKRKGSFCVFNEILKGITTAGLSPVQGLNPLLGLTPDSHSHLLYIGHIPLGRVPVCVLTDVSLPAEVRWDRQLARRVHEVPLVGAVDWVPCMRAEGISHLGKLRTQKPELCPVFDSLLSHVADQTRGKLLSDYANGLGFYRLDQLMNDEEDTLRGFFDAVCKHPEAGEKQAKRLGGRGWKLVNRDDDTDLANLWAVLADSDRWHESRRVQSADLRKVVGVPCEFESKPHGNAVAMRFVRRLNQRKVLCNREVLEDDAERVGRDGTGV